MTRAKPPNPDSRLPKPLPPTDCTKSLPKLTKKQSAPTNTFTPKWIRWKKVWYADAVDFGKQNALEVCVSSQVMRHSSRLQWLCMFVSLACVCLWLPQLWWRTNVLSMTSITIIHCRTDASPNQGVLSGKVIAMCCMNKLLQGYGNCEVPLHCCNTMILYCCNTRCLRYVIIALSYCQEAAYNYTATLFAFLCYCNS